MTNNKNKGDRFYPRRRPGFTTQSGSMNYTMQVMFPSFLDIKRLLIVLFLLLLTLGSGLAATKSHAAELYKLPGIEQTRFTESGRTFGFLQFTREATTDAGRKALAHLLVRLSDDAISGNAEKIQQWVADAVEQDDPIGFTLMGLFKRHGWHTQVDRDAAYALFQRASLLGEGFAEYQIAKMIEGEEFDPKIDALYEIKTKKQKAIRELFPETAEPKTILYQGKYEIDVSGGQEATDIFNEFSSGRLAGARDRRTMRHLERADLMGSPRAKFEFAMALFTGVHESIGYKKDRRRSMSMIYKAAEMGDPYAMARGAWLKTFATDQTDSVVAEEWGERLLTYGSPLFDVTYFALAVTHMRNGDIQKFEESTKRAWAITNQRSATVAAAYTLQFHDADPSNRQALEDEIKWSSIAYDLQDDSVRELHAGRVFLIVAERLLESAGLSRIREAEVWIDRAKDEGVGGAFNLVGRLCGGYLGHDKDDRCMLENLKSAAELARIFHEGRRAGLISC